jgi:hypothetical protein
MDKETKVIWESYVEDFTDNVKDYLKATKSDNWKNSLDWQSMLELTEQFRVDMLSVLDECSFNSKEVSNAK